MWTSWWTFVDVVPSVSCVCGVTCPVCVLSSVVERVLVLLRNTVGPAVPLPEKYICELGDAGV